MWQTAFAWLCGDTSQLLLLCFSGDKLACVLSTRKSGVARFHRLRPEMVSCFLSLSALEHRKQDFQWSYKEEIKSNIKSNQWNTQPSIYTLVHAFFLFHPNFPILNLQPSASFNSIFMHGLDPTNPSFLFSLTLLTRQFTFS